MESVEEVASDEDDGRQCKASEPHASPTKLAWLEAQRADWANSRRRRTQAAAQKAMDMLPALPTDAEFEEQLKREWLRRLKDDHESTMARRKALNMLDEGALLPLDGPLMPSDRDVWLLQKRRERELALRERRRLEIYAQLKPAVRLPGGHERAQDGQGEASNASMDDASNKQVNDVRAERTQPREGSERGFTDIDPVRSRAVASETAPGARCGTARAAAA